MSWKRIPLSEIAVFSNGVNFDKTAYSAGVKLISVSDFGNRFSPDYEGLQEVSENVVRTGDYLKNGDIVFVRSNGNKEFVGRCMLIGNPQYPVTYSGFCIRARIRDNCKYNPVFFTYYFKSKAFRKAMSGNAVGANIQNLSQGRLSNHVVYVPDIDIQNKISSVLSTYDYLIENNQKQIKLLEEAAQRLYKEWFVDLRFPGYQNTEIVDGVPEGWKKCFLSDIIGYEIGGGWGEEKPTERCDIPAYVIRGTDLYGITHGDSIGIPYRYHEKKNLDARWLVDGDIVFEVSGGSKTEGVARTTLIRSAMLEQWCEPVMCASFCKLIRVKEPKYAQLLFDAFRYMRASGKTAEYDKRSASSIVNYRWKDFLATETVLVPDELTLEKYNALADNMYQLTVQKSISIGKAKDARDRLLPKLMSGEIEM